MLQIETPVMEIYKLIETVAPIEKWAEVLSLKYIISLMNVDMEEDMNRYLLDIENNKYTDENRKIEITNKIKGKTERNQSESFGKTKNARQR